VGANPPARAGVDGTVHASTPQLFDEVGLQQHVPGDAGHRRPNRAQLPVAAQYRGDRRDQGPVVGVSFRDEAGATNQPGAALTVACDGRPHCRTSAHEMSPVARVGIGLAGPLRTGRVRSQSPSTLGYSRRHRPDTPGSE
jgi:hypothetical protein